MSQKAQPQAHPANPSPHPHPGDEDFEPPVTGTVQPTDPAPIIQEPPPYGGDGEED